jgi:hypothetical protein
MRRRCRAGEIVYLVEPRDARTERRDDVMLNELEPPACQQAADIFSPARLEIVNADDPMTLADQALAEVRPEKSRPSGDNYALW